MTTVGIALASSLQAGHCRGATPARRPASRRSGLVGEGVLLGASLVIDRRAAGVEADPVRHVESDPEATARELGAEIRAALGPDLTALYLYGSTVSGGFDPGVSDIDLVAVTARPVEAIDLGGLERMHARFVAEFPEWLDRIDVVYVEGDALRMFRTSHGRLAVISPGEAFHVRDEPPADWLQNWYLVRESGRTLRGPDPSSLVPPIDWPEFAQATARYAEEVRDRDRSELGAGAVAYAVLTVCRALRTVHTGTQASKQVAAAWIRERMPEWDWLIEDSLECRLAGGAKGFEDAGSRAAAERFIGLVADEIGAVGLMRPAVADQEGLVAGTGFEPVT